MGYYADSVWNIKITGNLADLANEIKEQGFDQGWRLFPADEEIKGVEEDIDVLLDAMRECNEDTDFSVSDDNRKITGWGGGKMLSQASDNSFWRTLSKYCTGTIDWKSNEGDDGFSRVRLYGDGNFDEFQGYIVYPEDRETA